MVPKLLVSVSPSSAPAQPIGQAKVAIIYARLFLFLLLFPLTKPLIKGGFSGQIDYSKSYKGYKVGQPKKIPLTCTSPSPKTCACCFGACTRKRAHAVSHF